MKARKKRLKMSKFERLLYVFTFALIVATPISIIFSQATLSKINYDVEKTKKKILVQQKKNESLEMKLDELASLDKIQEVAKAQGLGYNGDRHKTVTEGADKDEEEQEEEQK